MSIIEDWTDKVTVRDVRLLAELLPLPYEIMVDGRTRRIRIIRVDPRGDAHLLEEN